MDVAYDETATAFADWWTALGSLLICTTVDWNPHRNRHKGIFFIVVSYFFCQWQSLHIFLL
jgi:hypothetical protein